MSLQRKNQALGLQACDPYAGSVIHQYPPNRIFIKKINLVSMLPFWRRPPLYDTANIKRPVLLSPLYLYSASILLESEQHANQTIHQAS